MDQTPPLTPDEYHQAKEKYQSIESTMAAMDANDPARAELEAEHTRLAALLAVPPRSAGGESNPEEETWKAPPPPPPQKKGLAGKALGAMGIVAGDVRTAGVGEPEDRVYAGDDLIEEVPLSVKVNSLTGGWRSALFVVLAIFVLPIATNTAIKFDYAWLWEDDNWGVEGQGEVLSWERSGPSVDGHSTLQYTFTFTDADGKQHQGTSYNESVTQDHEHKRSGKRRRWEYVGGTEAEYQRGESVKVRYDPDDPTRSAIYKHRRGEETKEDLLAWLFIALALGFLWYRWSRARALWRALVRSRRLHTVITKYPEKFWDDPKVAIRGADGEIIELEISMSKSQMKQTDFDPGELTGMVDVGRTNKLFVLELQEPPIEISDQGVITTKGVWYRYPVALGMLLWPIAPVVVIIMKVMG